MPYLKVFVDVPFEIYCDECGAPLCREVSTGDDKIYVKPCKNCIEDKIAEAINKFVQNN